MAEKMNFRTLINVDDLSKLLVLDPYLGFAYKRITEADEEVLRSKNSNFSIMLSTSNNLTVLLGPLALVNHDCNPNCEYRAISKLEVVLVTLTKIKKETELFCYYGAEYFNQNNFGCECTTCREKNKIKSCLDNCSAEPVLGLEENTLPTYQSVAGFHDQEINELSRVPRTETEYSLNDGSDGLFLGFEKRTLSSYQGVTAFYNQKIIWLSNVPYDKKLFSQPSVNLTDSKLRTGEFSKKKLKDSSKVKRERAYCPYCMKFISKFHVHLETHHADEKSVKEFIHLKMSDKRRRNIISSIRHQGYGLYYTMTNNIILVSKRRAQGTVSVKRQCTYCYGHYSSKSLWKHIHICHANPKNLI